MFFLRQTTRVTRLDVPAICSILSQHTQKTHRFLIEEDTNYTYEKLEGQDDVSNVPVRSVWVGAAFPLMARDGGLLLAVLHGAEPSSDG